MFSVSVDELQLESIVREELSKKHKTYKKRPPKCSGLNVFQ
ncbi:hypothetical protein [Psychrobacillus sp. NPDC093200]